jgi:DNA-binding transcriptional regulator YiaG
MRFFTADKATGAFIEECDTYDEALRLIEEDEAEDKSNGEFTEGFYDIVDEHHCSVGIGIIPDITVTSVRALLNKHKITMRFLSTHFHIPLRTVENWSAGVSSPPDYLVRMMDELLTQK